MTLDEQFLVEKMHRAVDTANVAAGEPNGGWNKRWLTALNQEGFDLVASLPYPDYPALAAPKPYPVGLAYLYPSVIVEIGK